VCEVSEIPGLAELWKRTNGDDRIRIAVVDGPVDVEHPAFGGASLTYLGGIWPVESTRTSQATHGTMVASVLFGQHGGPVTGVAPGCRGLIVPVFAARRRKTSQLELARGIELAAEAGAQVINVSGGQLTRSGEADDPLARVVRSCIERNVLIVAAAGNDGCFCVHVPAALPSVLAVGALDDTGQPLPMSNWGSAYQRQGIMGPGENVLGAVPGGETARGTGTSLAAPIISGIAALLLSLQRRAGLVPDPLLVGTTLLATADPCDEPASQACLRFLGGKLNVAKAVEKIMTQRAEEPASVAPQSPCGCDFGGFAPGAPAERIVPPQSTPESMTAGSGVVTSTAEKVDHPVYAIGTLGYDFGSEARRDSFKQLMKPTTVNNSTIPVNPYDPGQITEHLATHPSEAKALIWTLNLELTPIYAIEPSGAYAADVYELLTKLLLGETNPPDSPDYIERVAVPGTLTGRTVRLFSGQVVPVIEIGQTRGLYGWEINRLTDAAILATNPDQANNETTRQALRDFLTRIYYDLRNLGATARDRALNFAATNAFQAAHTLTTALSRHLALDTITVEKSPFGRQDSDCWDVKLRFFDPENTRRAKRAYRFTIDVSDTLPVTVGDTREWPET
jgi:hypothetical protein